MRPSRETVLFVDSEREWRGGQNQELLLARRARLAGWRIVFAARRGSALGVRAREEGFEVLEAGMRGEWDLASAASIRRAARSSGARLVHAHASRAHGLSRLAGYGRPGLPLVVSRRVDFPIPRTPLSRWKYARGVAAILCVSEGVREALLRSGLPPGLLHTVRSGVDPGTLVPRRPRSETREALGATAESLLVGGIGALAPHKDHRTWIEVATRVLARVPAARFALAGDGRLRGDLEREIGARGLRERVRLLGFREDVPDLLGAFDVFLHSSRLEGLGTSLVDAAFAGLPIVATRTGGIPEVARDGENAALASPGDAPALAEALAAVLGDPARREEMGTASRRIALEFHADRMAAETLRIYDRLLAG